MAATILRFPEKRKPARAPSTVTVPVAAIEEVRRLVQGMTPNTSDPRTFYGRRDEADAQLWDMLNGNARA